MNEKSYNLLSQPGAQEKMMEKSILRQIQFLEQSINSLPPKKRGKFSSDDAKKFNRIMQTLLPLLNDDGFKKFVYQKKMSGDKKMPQEPTYEDVNRDTRLQNYLNWIKEYKNISH